MKMVNHFFVLITVLFIVYNNTSGVNVPSPWGPYLLQHIGVSYMVNETQAKIAHYAIVFGQYNDSNRSTIIEYDAEMADPGVTPYAFSPYMSFAFACTHCELDYSRWDLYSSFPNNYPPYSTIPALNGLSATVNFNFIRINDTNFLIIVKFNNTSGQTQKFHASLVGSTFFGLKSYDSGTGVLRTSVQVINQSKGLAIKHPDMPGTFAAAPALLTTSGWSAPLAENPKISTGILITTDFAPTLMNQTSAQQLFSAGQLQIDGKGIWAVVQQDNIVVPAGESRIIGFVIVKGTTSDGSDLPGLFSTVYQPSVLSLPPSSYNWPGTNDSWGRAMHGLMSQSLLNFVYNPNNYRLEPLPDRYYKRMYFWDSAMLTTGLVQTSPDLADKVLNLLIGNTSYNPTIDTMAWWTLYQRTGDKTLLSKYYSRAVTSNNSWDNIDPDNDGMFLYGYGQLGNGMDDGCTWEQSGGQPIEPPDESSYVIRQAKIIRLAAYELGKNQSEIDALTNRIQKLENAVNTYMWDDTQGWYEAVTANTNQRLNVVGDIIGAHPVYSGTASQDRFQRILQKLTDTARYWSGYGLRTADRTTSTDPVGACHNRADWAWDSGFYWRGAVWMPPDWKLWRGLIGYGEVNTARQLAYDILNNWCANYLSGPYFCRELFHSRTGQGMDKKLLTSFNGGVLDMYSAYCVTGTVTAGFDTVLRNINYDHNNDIMSFQAETPYYNGTTGFVVVMARPNYQYLVGTMTVVSDSRCSITFTRNMQSGIIENINIYPANAGPANKINLYANPSTIIANGISISTVIATVCDVNNIPVTDSTATITFSLSGSAGGTLVGTNPVQAVGGIAKIIYRCGTSSGTVTITGTSTGLTQGTVNITLQLPGTNNPPNAPSNLRCNGQTEPRGITGIPTLSWTFSDPDSGNTQSAYRVLVSSIQEQINNNIGRLWDTGKVISSVNSVTYSGSSLPAGATCYWKVMVWDNFDTSGSYSSIATFTMESQIKPVLKVSTTTLEFGELDAGQIATLTFDITNTGSGTLTGTIDTDQEWLTVDPPSFVIPAQAGIQTINVTVDNNVLNQKEGQYTGTITITSNGGTETISVVVTATCVLVKPNPYNPNKGLLTFFGSGIIPGETTIKIYTLSGELVKQLTSGTNKEIVWDGKTENGIPVTSGIYLYTYESPKEKGIGKFTVIYGEYRP